MGTMPKISPENEDSALAALRKGQSKSADELLPLIYDELRSLARRRLAGLAPGQTLQATALVNEANVRVVGDSDPGWDHAGHLFGAFAQAIRNILVDNARRKNRLKRGGEWNKIELDRAFLSADVPLDDEKLIALDDALQKLCKLDERKCRAVSLRFFAGCTTAQIAKMEGVSTRTVERDWEFARVWLHREIMGDNVAADDNQDK